MAVAIRRRRHRSDLPPRPGRRAHRGGLHRSVPAAGIRQSTGRTGSALDNAAIESFNSSLQFELLSVNHFHTRARAHQAVADWLDEYNRIVGTRLCPRRSAVQLQWHPHGGSLVASLGLAAAPAVRSRSERCSGAVCSVSPPDTEHRRTGSDVVMRVSRWSRIGQAPTGE
jgi:transposase InsO family protein